MADFCSPHHILSKNFYVRLPTGMRYLENEDLVHRDLAARNVLLDRNGVAKVVIGIDIAAQNIVTLFCPRKNSQLFPPRLQILASPKEKKM